MQRMKAAYPHLAKGWMLIDKINAQEFIKKSQHLFGNELKTEMNDLIYDTVIRTMGWDFMAAGGFYDKEWFDKHYEGREAQKENIFKYAKSYECKIRRVTLYQDPSFTEHDNDRMKRIEQCKRKMVEEEMDRKVKPRAKPNAKTRTKAKAKEKANKEAECEGESGGETADNLLSPKQEQKLYRAGDRLDVAISKITDLIEEAAEESIAAVIPTQTIVKCLAATCTAKEKSFAIQLALSNREAVDFHGIIKDGMLALEKTQRLCKELRDLVDVARTVVCYPQQAS